MDRLRKARFGWLARQLIPNAGTLIVLALFFLTRSVGARLSAMPATPGATTTLLSYQGTLTDQGGTPVDGDMEMVFDLYHEAEGGTPFWTEAYTGTQAIEVTNGQFHVLLGSQEALSPDNLTGDLYLGITVNGEEMLPRERLVSVVDAVNAEQAQGDFTVDGKLDVAGIGYFGTAGVGEGGQINLRKGSSGNDWTIDNRYGSLRAWHDGTTYLTLDEQGTLTTGGGIDMKGHDIDLGGGARIWTNSTDNVRIYVPDGTASEFTNSKFIPWRPIDMKGHSVSNCGALTEANLQTPEELAAERIDRFKEGDVLCWAGEQLEKCETVNDPLVQAVADEDGRPIVIGAEIIKVLGPVHYGDMLVASDVAGYAMVNNDPRPGSVIAQALEDFDGEQGLVKAMIRKF